MSVVFHVVCTIDQAVTVDNKHHGANKATLPSFWIRSLQLQSDISCNSPPTEYFSNRTVQHKHCTAPPLADRCGLFYSPYSCSSPAASPRQSLRWVRSTTSKKSSPSNNRLAPPTSTHYGTAISQPAIGVFAPAPSDILCITTRKHALNPSTL
jgi:hypothetical protein